MIYLICTPIGNLNDISLRSIEILNSSDLIYAEDTRKAQKIFDKYKIDKKSFSFNDHNERSKTKNIIQEAKAGKIISLISDAGAPLISDPGYILVNECIRENVQYSVIPGPSSVINSLLLSGFAINKFMFLGFLPRKDSERKKGESLLGSTPVVVLSAILGRIPTLDEYKVAVKDIKLTQFAPPIKKMVSKPDHLLSF